MTAALATLLLAFAGQGQGPDPSSEFVEVGPTAYGLLPAEPICGPTVLQLSWSSDSKYLLVKRQVVDMREMVKAQLLNDKNAKVTEPETELLVWSVKTRKAKTLLRLPQSQGSPEGLWLRDTSKVVLHTRAYGQDVATEKIGLIDAESLAYTSLYEGVIGVGTTEVHISPTTNWGVLARTPREDPNARTFALFGSRGLIGQPYVAPRGWASEWTADGKAFVVSVGTEYAALAPNVPAQKRLGDAPPQFYEAKDDGILKAVIVKFDGRLGKGALSGVYLAAKGATGPDSTAVVSTDATQGELAPNLSEVAYVTRGMAAVRPVVELPVEALRQARLAAQKMLAISNAKQVGLALIMYAADSDEKLPGQSDDFQGLIDPYLRNASIAQGFVYTFAGGKMSDIKDPATTVLGYNPGPGGRAVTYADGHVKWIND